MHGEAYDWFASEVAVLQPRRRVLEIGSRDINGSLRPLFAQPDVAYCGVDPLPGRGVDLVARGEDVQPPWAPDLILCAEVLEHVPDAQAQAICQHALAILAPGGVLLMSMATDPRVEHSQLDGRDLQPGEFYRNVRVEQLPDWLAGFEGVRWWVHPHGDLYVRAIKKGETCH